MAFLDNTGLAYFWGKVKGLLSAKEDVSNKVTSLSPSNTDDQYPSAKAAYDMITASGGVSAAGLLHVVADIVIPYADISAVQTPIADREFFVAELNEGQYYLLQASEDIYEGEALVTEAGNADIYTIGYDFETSLNKVGAITSASTHAKYPSAAAVWDLTSKLNTVTLSSSSWTLNSSTGYYTQTVSVTEITANSHPSASIVYPSGTTAASKKTIDKAASCLVSMTTANKQVTFSAVSAPATNLTIELKGV